MLHFPGSPDFEKFLAGRGAAAFNGDHENMKSNSEVKAVTSLYKVTLDGSRIGTYKVIRCAVKGDDGFKDMHREYDGTIPGMERKLSRDQYTLIYSSFKPLQISRMLDKYYLKEVLKTMRVGTAPIRQDGNLQIPFP